MSGPLVSEPIDADAVGFAPDGCAECGCAAATYHYPGCSFAPFVCPGCHAFDGAPCAEDCPDAEMERAFAELPDWTEPVNCNGDTFDGDGDWEHEPA